MNHGMEAVIETVVAAVFLGIVAQVLAHRFKLPAILPLLMIGMAAGPFGLHIFDPASLGHGLEAIIHLGVAIILFEGGLSIDPRQLRQIGSALRNLLVFGSLITAAGAAALAHWIIGVSWSTAILFGSIVTVTGPTVIAPLLRHLVAPRRVRTLLLSEGLMIDAIGAVFAYFVLQWIERAGLDLKVLVTELLMLGLSGAILGFVAGSLAIYVLRLRHMDDELSNLVILALLLGAFLAAEHQAPQSGILAAVVMVLTVSIREVVSLNPLKAFKGQLTVLIISFLFILLSGQLDLQSIFRLGPKAIFVVIGMIFLVRPLAVFLSISSRSLDLKERLVLAFNAPRGIVAAAVASLSAIQLRQTHAEGEAATLEGLVYLVILTTCAWASIMAPLLPRWLGYLDDPSRRRVVLVGANALSAALAKLFVSVGWTTVVVDSSTRKLAPLKEQGIKTVPLDAREAATYDEAGVERDTQIIATTPNDELNLLVAELVRDEFGVEHPVVVQQQASNELGRVRRTWIDLLGKRDLDLNRWSRMLEDGKARLLTQDLKHTPEARDNLRDLLREKPEQFYLICGWKDGKPEFDCSEENLGHVKQITVLVMEHLVQQISTLAPDPEANPEVDPEPEAPAAEEKPAPA